jgi:hypothetical protein
MPPLTLARRPRTALHYETLPDAISVVGQLLKSIEKCLPAFSVGHWFGVFTLLVVHDKYYLGLTK